MKTPQEMQYLRYLSEHRKRVSQAWEQLQNLFPEGEFVTNPALKSQINALIDTHDASKFGVDEFEPYRLHWYPAPGEKPNEVAYDRAWLHHKRCNPHHYEYWRNREFSMKRDFPFLIEMCCDWLSVSRVTGAVPAYDWLQENKEDVSSCLPSSAIVTLDYILQRCKSELGV